MHLGDLSFFKNPFQLNKQPTRRVACPSRVSVSAAGLIFYILLSLESLPLLADYTEPFPLLTLVAYIPGDQAWHMLMNVGFI